MSLNIARTRELLEGFDFRKLFVEELGWSNPVTPTSIVSESNEFAFNRRQIAHLGGVVVFEIDGYYTFRIYRYTLIKNCKIMVK